MDYKQSANHHWERYLIWNTAVAEVIYPESDDAAPAYMDLEAETLQKIATAAHEDSADPRKALAAAIASVTLDHSTFSLVNLLDKTQRWPIRSVEPPPCLAFLALTVVAAEDMGNTNEGLASTAYYARLARLIGLKDDDTALRRQYQISAELLWKRVNRWLENLEGERGVPTAFSLTHRYVGLPMSQALVRQADRQRLPAMFNQFGLSPGMRVAPSDLIAYLDEWLTAESPTATANLRRIWKRADSHDRIAAIAAVELANWDGIQCTSGTTSTTGRAVVVANIRRGFLGTSLDLSIGVRPIASDLDGNMEIFETAGNWLPIGFTPGAAGLWRNNHTELIDFGSILEGLVHLRHRGGGNGFDYKRYPRQVVPLIYDELQSAFVQADRLQLGVNALILVRTNSTRGNTPDPAVEVERILRDCARPGFESTTTIDGLPDGWTLFSDVQLFAAPTSTRFNELVPLARNQLTIGGGLQIPSRIRKWSTVSPPEVRATVQGETNLRVTLTEMDTDLLVETWTSTTGSLVAPLAELDLTDGDFQVSLFAGDGRVPTQQISIRLRSGETPDLLTWNRSPRLTYTLDSPLGVLSASEGEARDIVVDGLACDGEQTIPATETARSTVFWSKPRRVAVKYRVMVGTPDPTSCIATGAHHIKLPTAYGGNTPKFIQGECISCGLIKRYPGWLRRNRRAVGTESVNTESPLIAVADLPSVAKTNIDWDAGFDALIHLGGGSVSSLDNIARQLEGSALYADVFLRSLEALGHIAIERNQRGRPLRWELSPSCLAQMSNGQFKLTGRWTRQSVGSIRSQFGEGIIAMITPTAGPLISALPELESSDLERIAELEGGTVVPESGSTLLRALPRLSDVAAALERVSVPGFETAEKFELASATWLPTGDLANPGAYRIKRGFEILYIYRDENDVSTNTAAITGVHLAKHLAANAIGRTFAFYVEKAEALLTPRGCELPGLYDRAVVAFSGSLPTSKVVTVATQKRNCLQYSGVSRDDADLLATLLTT